MANFKTCPRCHGKGWTYYRGYRCSLCRGRKQVPEHVHLCTGLCRQTQVVCAAAGWHYQTVIRKCRRPASETVGGKHYCWQHNPADGYAKRRRWLACKRYKHTTDTASPALRARWQKQAAAIRAAVKAEGKA